MNRFQEIRQSARVFWNDRTAQERRLLSFGGLFLLLALVYIILLEPAIEGRTQLRKNLPVMRQQVAELQAMTGDASALTQAAAQPAGPVTQASVESSLGRQGMKAQSVNVTGEFVRLQLSGVPFAALAAWLDEARRAMRLSVTEATVNGLPQAGSVDANLTLRQQRSGE